MTPLTFTSHPSRLVAGRWVHEFVRNDGARLWHEYVRVVPSREELFAAVDWDSMRRELSDTVETSTGLFRG